MEYADAEARVAALRNPDDPVAGALSILAAFDASPELAEAYREGKVGNPITVRTGVDPMEMAANLMEAVPQRAGKWVQNIQRPKANPQTAAIAAAGKWTNAVQAAIARGAFASGVRSYNLDEAISSAVADGGAAWVAGIQKRRAKIERGMQQAARMLNAVTAQVRGMPQDTPEQRTARAVAQIVGMRAAKAGTTVSGR